MLRLFSILFALVLGVAAIAGAAALMLGRMLAGLAKGAGSKKESDQPMSRRRSRQETPPLDPDLARQRVASAMFDRELKRLKDMEREERRRWSRMQGTWNLIGIGSGIAFFGVIMGLELFPLIGIGGGIALAAVIAAFGRSMVERARQKARFMSPGTPVPQRPQIEAPVVEALALPNGRAELIQKVLGEATGSLRALDQIMSRLRHPDSVASVAGIVAAGNRTMGAVAAQPDKFAAAQRLFTYYMPEAVKVAEALALMEADPQPDGPRIQSTQHVLQKLTVLFDRTELELKATDAQALDIDLRLLDKSLEEDLKTR
jgi:5-bromo-4-chloroindolyl phosphate hydrolysis protein